MEVFRNIKDRPEEINGNSDGKKKKFFKKRLKNTYNKMAASLLVASTLAFGVKTARAEDAEVSEEQAYEERVIEQAIRAAENIRDFLTLNDHDARSRFLEIFRENREDDFFMENFETFFVSLVRINDEGQPTMEDAFINRWSGGEPIDYIDLIRAVDHLHELGRSAARIVRDTLLSGDEAGPADYRDIMGRNYLDQTLRENPFFRRGFLENQDLFKEGDSGEIFRAYQAGRVATAIMDSLSYVEEGELSDEGETEIEERYGLGFLERFRENFIHLEMDQHTTSRDIEEAILNAHALDEDELTASQTALLNIRDYLQMPMRDMLSDAVGVYDALGDGGGSRTEQAAEAIHEAISARGGEGLSQDEREQMEEQYGERFVELFDAERLGMDDGGTEGSIERAIRQAINSDNPSSHQEYLLELRDSIEMPEDEAPTAREVQSLEEEYGAFFVRTIQERASEAYVDEEEQERMERRSRLALGDAFSALLNADNIVSGSGFDEGILTGSTSTSERSMSRFSGHYERMNEPEQAHFRRFAARILEEWNELGRGDGGRVEPDVVEAFFEQHFPRMPSLSSEHAARFSMIFDVMSSFVSNGRFRIEDYHRSIENTANAFSSYLAISSRAGRGEWTRADQEAFSRVIIERAEAARQGRPCDRVRIPEGGERGRRIANELIPGNLGMGSREEQVRALQARALIADLITYEVFGYDWEVVATMSLGGSALISDENIGEMREYTSIARLARLHWSIMENSRFRSARDGFITHMLGPDFELEPSEDSEEEDSLEGSRYVDMLDDMDLLTQFAFVAEAFPVIRQESGTLLMLDEQEGRAIERNADTRESMIYLLDQVDLFTRARARGAGPGFMINAIPLTLHYSNTYNDVVTILNTIIMTTSSIQNTSLYDYEGRGRVGFIYTMNQVPRNFEEANNDNYNQLIDMLLRNPHASDYLSRNMRRDMFDVRTMAEMFRRFINTYGHRAGAIRPSQIHPRRAPQDFSLTGPLVGMEEGIRRRSRMDFAGAITGMEMLEDEMVGQTIQDMVMGSGDQRLIRMWRDNADIAEEFMNFFRFSSVSLVPDRDYRVISFIPMSISSLLRRLSSVEGIDRLIYPADLRSIHGYAGLSLDRGSFEQTEGGTPAEQQSSREVEGEGRGQLLVRHWGPRQEWSLDGSVTYDAQSDLGEMTEEERWASTQNLIMNDLPLFDDDLATFRSRLRASESGRTSGSETPEGLSQEDRVTDLRLIETLNWYAREHDTDGMLFVSGHHDWDESSSANEDGTLTTESDSSHDWRVHSYAKVQNNWYRIGYIDVSDERLRRFFAGAQLPDQLRNGGEIRALVGSEPRRDQTEGETEQQMEVEEETRLEGMLVGVNISNLIASEIPLNITLANIENFGRAIDDLHTGLPEDEAAAMNRTRLEEYANGISFLFDHEPTSGLVRTLGFVTFNIRRYRTTRIYDTAEGAEEQEGPEEYHGGAGTVWRMTGEREQSGRSGRAIEFGLTVGEQIGNSPVREVQVEWTETVDGQEVTMTEWRNAAEVDDDANIVNERRVLRSRQERVGATVAWRSANFGASGLHTMIVAQTEAFEDARGVGGFMYDDDNNRHWFGVVGGRYDPYYENHEGHGVFGVRDNDINVQLSGLYSHAGIMTRLDEIDRNLESAYRQYSELTSGTGHPEDLGEAEGRSHRVQDLEMRIEYYQTLRTALGIIGAQKFFGTGKWEQRWGDRTRSALEALYGGFDQNSLMMNGYVTVDEAFAASLNMTAMPWGSAGGKVVVPLAEVILAATAGGYWRDDITGGSGYGGALWQRTCGNSESDDQEESEEDSESAGRNCGLGFILGGSNRSSSFGEDGESLDIERNRIEGMILNWHPVGEDTGMQEYIVLSRTWGGNMFDMELMPESEIETWRAGMGARIDWVDDRGVSWRALVDFIYRNTQNDSRPVPELSPGRGFTRNVYSGRAGVEASPRDDMNFRLMFNLQHVNDEWEEEGTTYDYNGTNAGMMLYFRWDF